MAQDFQQFTLRGGIDKDSSLNDIKSEDYAHAQDCDFFSDNGNETNECRPINSMGYSYIIPKQTTLQLKAYEFDFDPQYGQYYISIRWGNNQFFDSASVIATNAASLVSAINSSIGTYITASLVFGNRIVVTQDTDISDLVFQIGGYTPDTQISYLPLRCIQDYCQPTEFKQIESCQYLNNMFILSKGVSFPTYELGVVKTSINNVSGDEVKTYVRLGRGRQFNFPETEKIQLRIERFDDEIIAIYYTDNTNTPRVIYLSETLQIDDIATRYSFDELQSQLRLQLINNIGRVTLHQQNNGGGSLKAGGKRYAVRFLRGNSFTEWSDLSGLVPVYAASTDAAAYRILGNQAGAQTTKSNVLRVWDANPAVFDFVQVAVVNYNDEQAADAQIIGKYKVNSSILEITHRGDEVGETLDVGTLINNVIPVINKAKTLEIKDNRLNLANVEIAASEDLTSIFENVQQSTVKEDLDWVGKSVFEQKDVPRAKIDTAAAQNNVDVNVWSSNIIFQNAVSGGTFYNTGNGDYLTSGTYDSLYIELPFSATPPSAIDFESFAFNYQFQMLLNGVPVASSGLLTFEAPATNDSTFNTILSWTAPRVQTSITGIITIQFAAYSNGQKIYVIEQDPDTGIFVVNEKGELFFSEYAIGNGGGITFFSSANDTIGIDEIKYGEFQKPENVANKTGYMNKEVYCFAARIHYKNGYVSKPYPIGFETLNYKSVKGHYQIDGDNFDNALTSDQSTFQSGVNPKVYSYGVKFDNIDITNIRDEIVGISICRNEPTNHKVIASGLFMRAEDTKLIGSSPSFLSGFYPSRTDVSTSFATAPAKINENGSLSYLRRYGSFLSPDNLFGETEINKSNYDILIYANNFKNSTRPYNSVSEIAGNNYLGYMAEYCMDGMAGSSVQVRPIEDISKCEFNSTSQTLIETTGTRRGIRLYNTSDANHRSATFRGYALALDANITPPVDDYGVYYSQIVTQSDPVYNLDDIDYKPIHYISITGETPNIINNVVVFGGDTYTQKTYVKLNYGSADAELYRTGAISFYSQNRVNTQLRNVDTNDYPMFPYNGNLVQWLNNRSGREETFTYNTGYIAPNTVNSDKGYIKSLEQNGKKGSSIYYSEQKPINATQDLYRDFKPLNLKELDPKDGDIVGIYDVRDLMIAIQRDAVWVLPYQSDTLIGTNSGDIVVGSGGVYSRRGNKISTIGTELTTATVLAKNSAGNPQLYWYSTSYKKFMRYSYDGIKVISDANNMRTWFLNNTNFIKNEFDIHMGYDTNKANLLITSRANIPVQQWSVGGTYTTGNLVQFIGKNPSTYEGLPDIYRGLVSVINSNIIPSSNSQWELLDTTDANYYNYWTLIFNENRNSFTTFASFLPSRYFMFNNQVYIPNVVSDYGVGFLHEGGTDQLKWYEYNGNYKNGEFIIEPVLNKYGNVEKRIIATALTLGGTEYDNNKPTLETISDLNLSSQNSPDDFWYDRGQYRTSNNTDYNDEMVVGNSIRLRVTSTLPISVEDLVAKFYARHRLPMK